VWFDNQVFEVMFCMTMLPKIDSAATVRSIGNPAVEDVDATVVPAVLDANAV
jgi:hypothetical protein